MAEALMTGPLKTLESLDDLVEELSLGSARGGRRVAETAVTVAVIRPLTPEDLPRLQEPVSSLPSIPQIKHQHHQIAGLIAKGCSGAEISLITGYSPSYISVLKSAPDMKELVAYYSIQTEAAQVDALVRLKSLGVSATEELQQRLNDEPEKFTSAQLMDMIEIGLLKPGAIAAAFKGAKSQQPTGPSINIIFREPPGGGSQAGVIIEQAADA